jgi:ribonuclease VapC
MSMANFVEASIVIESRYGAEGIRDLDLFIERAAIELVEVTLAQGHAARRAFARYGKGRHPAGLNFGDCFAYALATDRSEPLLFKGGDFDQTDVFRG